MGAEKQVRILREGLLQSLMIVDEDSVRSRPGARRGPAGGLPSAPDGTGRLAIVRPGRPKGRTAVFGQDGGPYRVRHVGTG